MSNEEEITKNFRLRLKRENESSLERGGSNGIMAERVLGCIGSYLEVLLLPIRE